MLKKNYQLFFTLGMLIISTSLVGANFQTHTTFNVKVLSVSPFPSIKISPRSGGMDINADELKKFLKANSYDLVDLSFCRLQELPLFSCKKIIFDGNVPTVENFLQPNTTLRVLSIKNGDIAVSIDDMDESNQYFYESFLEKYTHLQELYFDGTSLHERSPSYAVICTLPTTLRVFSLQRCSIIPEVFAKLLEKVQELSQLEVLDLSDNNLLNADCYDALGKDTRTGKARTYTHPTAVDELLDQESFKKTPCSLIKLSLRNCDLRFLPNIDHLENLEELDLSQNPQLLHNAKAQAYINTLASTLPLLRITQEEIKEDADDSEVATGYSQQIDCSPPSSPVSWRISPEPSPQRPARKKVSSSTNPIQVPRQREASFTTPSSSTTGSPDRPSAFRRLTDQPINIGSPFGSPARSSTFQ